MARNAEGGEWFAQAAGWGGAVFFGVQLPEQMPDEFKQWLATAQVPVGGLQLDLASNLFLFGLCLLVAVFLARNWLGTRWSEAVGFLLAPSIGVLASASSVPIPNDWTTVQGLTACYVLFAAGTLRCLPSRRAERERSRAQPHSELHRRATAHAAHHRAFRPATSRAPRGRTENLSHQPPPRNGQHADQRRRKRPQGGACWRRAETAGTILARGVAGRTAYRRVAPRRETGQRPRRVPVPTVPARHRRAHSHRPA